MISEADHQRIMAAVAKAEAATDGEIVCVMSQEVSRYREVPIGFAALIALAGPALAVASGLTPWSLVLDGARRLEGGWTASRALNETDLSLILGLYAVIQTLIFAVTVLVASIPPVRRSLTPRALKQHRVHKAAWAQFAATGLHLTEGRTGVLIFASLHDRVVEIVAEEDIHKKVGDAVWSAAVAAVQAGMKSGKAADGFVQAVEICGAALAQHFPSTGPHANDLPDRLLEI